MADSWADEDFGWGNLNGFGQPAKPNPTPAPQEDLDNPVFDSFGQLPDSADPELVQNLTAQYAVPGFTPEQIEYLEWRGIDPSDPFEMATVPTPTEKDIQFMREQKKLAAEMNARNFAGKKSVADLVGIDEEIPELKQDIHCIRQESWDEDLFRDMVRYSPRLKKVLFKAREILRTLPYLGQDQFLALFKVKPELVAEDEVIKEYRINHKLMTITLGLKEYADFSELCKLDYFSSAIGTEVLMEKILEMVEKMVEEHKQKAEEAKQASQPDPNAQNGAPNFADWIKAINDASDAENTLHGTGRDDIQDILDSWDPQFDENDPGLPGHSQNLMTPEQAKKRLKECKPVIEKGLEVHEKTMRQIVKKAVGTGKAEVSQIRETIAQWGFDPGEGSIRVDVESKRLAVERIRKNPKFKKFAKLIGRFRRMAQEEQKRKSKEGATNIKSVQAGGDIIQALPSELGQLAHPVTRMDVMRRWQEKQLLQYELENVQTSGKGPMVVCIDTSGSMHGTREEWSKALAMALIEVAQKQKRDFACIHFDSRVAGVWVIKKGEFDPNTVVDIVERFSNGGTDFKPPLEKALEIIQENKFKKADIVFITDGDSYIDEEFMKHFMEVKKNKEFFVRSVLINVSGGGSLAGVKDWSDTIASISDLADLDAGDGSDVAKAIFSQV